MKITKETYHDKRGREIPKSKLKPDLSNVASMKRDYTMSLDECEKFLEKFKSQP